jgi:hypothetical protein
MTRHTVCLNCTNVDAILGGTSMRAIAVATAVVLALGYATTARADVIVSVPGTSDPWLAGMPPGSTASAGDVAPAQSPAEVLGLAFAPGSLLTFISDGSTDHCDFGSCGLAGADGDLVEPPTGHATGVGGAENGLSNVVAPIDSLIGVFLGPGAPDGSPAPAGLNFSTPALRDFASLSPLLKQTFFIGNGLRNDFTTLQTFVVPAGATRLFLGTMDGFGWFNNVGALRTTVAIAGASVPEPGTLALLGIGLAAALRRARRVASR